jgi:PKD repeat protein
MPVWSNGKGQVLNTNNVTLTYDETGLLTVTLTVNFISI